MAITYLHDIQYYPYFVVYINHTAPINGMGALWP